MKIVELTAENVKRLVAVDITPDPHVQVISGRNGHGKTSVLDAIWLALGGGTAAKATARPVRDGADTAQVRLDLGDYVVTRTWSGEKSTLKVESADGARFSSPQSLLDGLVGRLSFDPLAFTQMPAREQRDALLSLVDLPFDPADLDRRRAALFEERTVIGRDVRQFEAQLASLPPVPDGVPEVEVSSAEVVAELQGARAVLADIDRVTREAEQAQSQRERAQAALDAAQAALDEAIEAEDLVRWRVQALPEPPDTQSIEARLASLDDVNAAVRARRERERVAEAAREARDAYDQRTADIIALDREKELGLSSATFPIDGLGFDNDGVTYRGVPFSQASSAEQIRVSLAMAMALNPKLRVIRILDGSLLDAENLSLVQQMAVEKDYQVWVEKVDDGSGVGVLIEDGQVAA